MACPPMRSGVRCASLGHTAYHHIGDDGSIAATNPDPAVVQLAPPESSSSSFGFMDVLRMAVVGAAAYHGYKRNQSVGWAVAWGLASQLNAPITIGVALAQGFSQRKA